MRGLKDKTVLLTGGANGIGAAIARRLAEEGCVVGILDLDAAGGEKVAGEVVYPAVAGAGRVHGGPGGRVGRGLDAVRTAEGRLPVQAYATDRRRRTEIDLQPLRVGELARPPGAGVRVHGVGRGEGRVLGRGGRRRPPPRDQRVGGGGGQRHGDERSGGERDPGPDGRPSECSRMSYSWPLGEGVPKL